MPNDERFHGLLAAAQSGDREAEQRLIAENMPLVYAVAKRYTGCGTDADDLYQLGAIGLLKAIRRFDSSYEVCFSTYAVPMIAGEIKRFLRDDGIIRYSRSVKELAYRIRKISAEHPELTVSELAREIGASEADIAAALASETAPRSLDEPDPITGDPFGLSIAAENDEPHADDRMLLGALLDDLTERERTILQLRYFEEQTQTEVGRRLGVSQVQISRLEKKILLQLRAKTKQEGSI
ncbi:MAG: sigma-70 family RNA polymerase sigma factor [Clostridia bacterium]|nr:sigma-70 family RNA polymerase sigma factor [Clostridia bacterium]